LDISSASDLAQTDAEDEYDGFGFEDNPTFAPDTASEVFSYLNHSLYHLGLMMFTCSHIDVIVHSAGDTIAGCVTTLLESQVGGFQGVSHELARLAYERLAVERELVMDDLPPMYESTTLFELDSEPGHANHGLACSAFIESAMAGEFDAAGNVLFAVCNMQPAGMDENDKASDLCTFLAKVLIITSTVLFGEQHPDLVSSAEGDG
jgi:hypothetical protein